MSASIRSRVLALVGAGVFVAAGALTLLGRSSLLKLERQIDSDRDRFATALAANVAGVLDDDLRLLATAAAAPRVDLADLSWLAEQNALDAMFPHVHFWSSVSFVRETGEVVAVQPAANRRRFQSDTARQFILSAIDTGRPAVSGVISRPEGGGYIVAAVPFRAGEGERGAVAGAIDLPSRRLMALLRAAVGSGMEVEIVDSNGRAIASTLAAEWSRSVRTRAAVASTTPWVLTVLNTGPDPLAPIALFRRQSLWLAPTLAALAMVFAYGMARSIRRPLIGLTTAAERIARGDLEQEIEMSGAASAGGEIDRLAIALERMRRSLRASMEQIERSNRELERRVDERTRELGALNARLQERERMRQHLLRTVISAQEDERKRIARELHDETSQTLAALGMGVDAALAASGTPDEPRWTELKRLVGRMDDELHRLIVNLRPSVLDDLGLAAAIRWFAERHLRAAGISVRCELNDLETRLPTETETEVFRAVQEAIVNISRHANADSVLIQGSIDEHVLTIEVEDDGQGFEVAKATDGPDSLRGIGLLGMRERIEILGGMLDIDSEPGHGTRIVMNVPVAIVS